MGAHTTMRISSWGSLFVVLVAALGSPRAARAANAWGADYFPNAPLTTQDGQVVHFYDDVLKGKNVAINLIYTRCTASCPLETAKLAQVQRLLQDRVGKDVFFYSISIDPKHDTPEALKAYMKKFHTGPGWTFLTGSKEDIREISRKLGLSSLTDAGNKDGHQPTLMIGNEPSGQWMMNSAVDNPRFLATTMLKFYDSIPPESPAAAKPETKAMPSALATQSYADVPLATRYDEGDLKFQSRCSACHTIGGGDAIGPDLLDVHARRDRAWLVNYILEPDRMLAQHDPIAMTLFGRYKTVRMPNLNLTPEDTEKVIKYIQQRSKVAGQHATAETH
jgi:protein SCO1/2